MSSSFAYRIVDDPRPTRLSRLVINPFYVLLLSMIFMILIGPLWLLFNSFAMGSPRAKKELLVVIASVIVFVIFFMTYVVTQSMPGETGGDVATVAPYVRLIVNAYWIAVCYYLFMSQMKIYPLFRYFRERAAGLGSGG